MQLKLLPHWFALASALFTITIKSEDRGEPPTLSLRRKRDDRDLEILEIRRHFWMTPLALLLILLVSAGTAAATSLSQTFVAVQAPRSMALDPQLRDPVWAQGAINGSEFENLTTRTPAILPTSVYLLYDRQNLYIGFKAEQTGVPITATQTTNDVGFGLDDFVGVAIDTTGAGNDVYFFETTPKGVRYQQANENVRYDPRWQSAAHVEGSSWTAEIIIPLNVLRIRPGAQNSWRLNFVRSIAARNEHYTWYFNRLMVDGQVGQTWLRLPTRAIGRRLS